MTTEKSNKGIGQSFEAEVPDLVDGALGDVRLRTSVASATSKSKSCRPESRMTPVETYVVHGSFPPTMSASASLAPIANRTFRKVESKKRKLRSSSCVLPWLPIT